MQLRTLRCVCVCVSCVCMHTSRGVCGYVCVHLCTLEEAWLLFCTVFLPAQVSQLQVCGVHLASQRSARVCVLCTGCSSQDQDPQ